MCQNDKKWEVSRHLHQHAHAGMTAAGGEGISIPMEVKRWLFLGYLSAQVKKRKKWQMIGESHKNSYYQIPGKQCRLRQIFLQTSFLPCNERDSRHTNRQMINKEYFCEMRKKKPNKAILSKFSDFFFENAKNYPSRCEVILTLWTGKKYI